MSGFLAYDEDAAAEICERISCGESLKSIVRDEHMPGERAVFQWLRTQDAFAQLYARAREAQADADADLVGDVAQRVMKGELDPNAARVAIDALKWSAGKRKPKVYGERLDLNHSGSVATQTEEELDARIAQLARKAGIGGLVAGEVAEEISQPAG